MNACRSQIKHLFILIIDGGGYTSVQSCNLYETIPINCFQAGPGIIKKKPKEDKRIKDQSILIAQFLTVSHVRRRELNRSPGILRANIRIRANTVNSF